MINIFLLPLELCSEIERLLNAFWWGCQGEENKGIRWTTWDRLCTPKKFEGLGFKRLRQFDIAMLAKYYPRCSFLEAELGNNPRRSIMAARDMVKSGSRLRIGNGESVSIWNSPWLPCAGSGMVSTAVLEGLADAKVSNLMQPDSREWDLDLLWDLFDARDVSLICSTPLSHRLVQDSSYWIYDNKGRFSIRSCYRVLQGELSQVGASSWQKLWMVKVPPKVEN